MIATSVFHRVSGALWGCRLRQLLRAPLYVAAVVLVFGGPASLARAEEVPVDSVKVAFLFNFAKFADWPVDSFVDATSPLNVCILGGVPGEGAFESLKGKRVRARSIVVRRVETIDEAPGCQVLYRIDDRERRIRAELGAMDGKPTLTVGETDGFCEWGGIINFVLVEGKVRFEINPDAAQRAGIRLSAQLLRLARIVHDED